MKTHNIKSWLSENSVFLSTVLIAVLVIVFGAIFSKELGTISGVIMSWVSFNFGWLYIWSVVIFCIFCAWIAFSKYGKIKLGGDNEKPEFSNFSWYSMLFCGSTGIEKWGHALRVEKWMRALPAISLP